MSGPIAIATAALIREGRILMAHRHPQRRWYPDCWDLVGGHVERGELPVEAVVRECLEELGVRAHSPTPFPMPFSDPTLELHAFLVTSWEGEPANCADRAGHPVLHRLHPRDRSRAGAEGEGLTMADPLAIPSIQTAIARAAD